MIFMLSVPVCAFAEESVGVYNVNVDNNMSSDIKTFSIINNLESPAPKEISLLKINVENVTDNAAVLKWKANRVYLGYTVCKYNIIKGVWENYAQTSKQHYRLTGLLADTTYRFCIKSANTQEMLGVCEFTTNTQKASIHIDEITSDSVSMSFKNVNKKAELILYKSSDDSDKFKKIAHLKKERSYVDTDVEEGKVYRYMVKSYVRRHGIRVGSENSTVKQAATAINMDLPDVTGKTKTYAYYTAVTAKSTPQYKLLNSAECYTDEETGIRMVDDCYCVALGSFYGTTIGTKYRITLDTGKSFKVILCDQKSNRHTDEKHQYAVRNKDIVEFYVEKSKIPSGICGSYDNLEQFHGNIVSIEKYV